MRKSTEISLLLFAVLLIIVAFALIFGVGNVQIGQSGLKTVSVLAQSKIYGPTSLSSLNVTYSSVGIKYTYHNQSQWHYQNQTGVLELNGLQNNSYVIAQFGIPQNATITGAEMSVSSSRATTSGYSQNTYLLKGVIYANVSNPQTSGSVLLELVPSVMAVSNISAVSLGIRPQLYAAYQNTSSGGVGSSSPANSTRFNSTQGLTITGGSVSQSGTQTSVEVALRNNGNSPITVYAATVSGNFTVEQVTPNSSIIKSVAGTILNSNSVQQELGANLTANVKSILGSSVSLNVSSLSGIAGSVDSKLGNLSGGFGSIESSLSSIFNGLSSSGSSTSSLSGIANTGLSDVQGLLGKLGGASNVSLVKNIATTVITQAYGSYVNTSANLKTQEESLGAVTLLINKHGSLSTVSSLSQLLNSSYGFTIMPYQSVILNFTGPLSGGLGSNIFTALPNNTYKIIIIGDNSTAYASIGSG